MTLCFWGEKSVCRSKGNTKEKKCFYLNQSSNWKIVTNMPTNKSIS